MIGITNFENRSSITDHVSGYVMLRSQRFVRTIISYESPCFSIVFPNFHCLKIVRTAFVAVRNGICDRGLRFEEPCLSGDFHTFDNRVKKLTNYFHLSKNLTFNINLLSIIYRYKVNKITQSFRWVTCSSEIETLTCEGYLKDDSGFEIRYTLEPSIQSLVNLVSLGHNMAYILLFCACPTKQ